MPKSAVPTRRKNAPLPQTQAKDLAQIFIDALPEHFDSVHDIEDHNASANVKALGQTCGPLPKGRPSLGQVCAAVLLAQKLNESDELRRALQSQQPVVLIRTVGSLLPTDVADVFKFCIFSPKLETGFERSGPTRRSEFPMVITDETLRRRRNDHQAVIAGLQKPAPIVAIGAELQDFPEVLRAAADFELEIGQFDAAAINRIIQWHFDARPAVDLDKELLALATINELVVAFRSGNADACTTKLKALLVKKQPGSQAALPRSVVRLEDLPGFGKAREWGLSLAADIEQVRNGDLSWSDIDSRSLLLFGPPGTGKTAFMRALSVTTGLPLIETSVADWNAAGHLGDTLKALTASFAKAKAKSPSILFIDELDGISNRATLSGDHIEYWSQIVNLLLTQISALEQHPNIILVAATNFKEVIDPAVLRSGRLDLHIEVQKPNRAAISDILEFYLPGQLSPDERRRLALETLGCTGADLQKIVRRAMTTARRKKRDLTYADVEAEVLVDRQRMPEHARRMTAVHEAGHIVLACVLGMPVSEAYINAKGGVTHIDLPSGHGGVAELDDTITVLLAGRAAEELEFGKVSPFAGAGPDSDLAVATRIARDCELRFGLGILDQVYIEMGEPASLMVPGVLDSIRHRLDRCIARASAILIEQRPLLDAMSAALFRRGGLDVDEIKTIVLKHRVHD